ncbi:hypothetical protein ACHAXT_005606 [Thalassiosira profunda]
MECTMMNAPMMLDNDRPCSRPGLRNSARSSGFGSSFGSAHAAASAGRALLGRPKCRPDHIAVPSTTDSRSPSASGTSNGSLRRIRHLTAACRTSGMVSCLSSLSSASHFPSFADRTNSRYSRDSRRYVPKAERMNAEFALVEDAPSASSTRVHFRSACAQEPSYDQCSLTRKRLQPPSAEELFAQVSQSISTTSRSPNLKQARSMEARLGRRLLRRKCLSC